MSANAYIGSEGQIQALAEGANLVITGRATDSSVHIAPMVHEFGWSTCDWNLMGAAIAVGHVIECSSGCAGGMSNFWKDVKEPWRVAFPIAEMYENGEAVITKANGSGRMVTDWTVKEHLVYEVHDPKRYLMADGVADLSERRIETVGPDRVKVSGFKGSPRPDTLKLCLGYEDGWIGESEISVCWPDAYEKAQFCEKFLRGRFEALKLPILEMRIDFIGLNSIHGPLAPLPTALEEINEVRVRVAVKTTSKEWANLVRREVTHLWTHGPVGTTAVISPPPPRQVISLWPTLIPRELRPANLGDAGGAMMARLALRDLAYARSGDKGDIVNIGVMAKNAEAYALLKRHLTPDRVKRHFTGIVKGDVVRYDLDNLESLEFVMRNALGGGPPGR